MVAAGDPPRPRARKGKRANSEEGEIPATGNTVVWESADYIKARGGRILSWHAYNDQLATLVQLGLVPVPAGWPG
jgi:ketosteroid isomerase-like protein